MVKLINKIIMNIKLLTLIGLLNLIYACSSETNEYISNATLDCLLENKNYSDLLYEITENKEAYDEDKLLYYEIVLQSVLNNPKKSNQLIRLFYEKYNIYSDTVGYNITEIEYNNFYKLADYKNRFKISKKLSEKYKPFYDSVEYAELIDNKIDSLLGKEAPISMTMNSDCKLNIKIDIARNNVLPVKGSNDTIVDFIFDTGASVNVVSQETAKKINLRFILNSEVNIIGANGDAIKAKIAIADKIYIGDIEFKNVNFVVFADSTLTFSKGYKMRGIIGFPVFNLFEEIVLTDSTIFIPQKSTKKEIEPNFFTYGSVCIISLKYGNKKIPFLFDTGFNTSYFYKNFYNLDSLNFNKLDVLNLTIRGLDGFKTMKGIIIPEIEFECANKKFQFKDAIIQLEYNHSHKKLNGNIGRDFIRQYEKRIINFKYSYICFE